ncbi:hypothetical protein G6027_05640 [Dietzia sp. SLG310A2-38A2]|uniref:ScbA/BarX family gamma-butyrolactone biosynthesis protein n=1 Tax=Dietzia sp. SLG310A2-38A2 TaxID=1630643 RepID=UPI0015FDF8D5|nr:ScbA/BarX family gamma-butyrolactone biosynthesis protein [Dietzia sp. SLG310A2-38A2]MBB1030375.1 hypothetical protein [Dietzia sp. SLG310A2-38A2]
MQPTSGLKLSHTHTVPRNLVHRRAVAEVFPTDSATDGDRLLVACQLPAGHALYNDREQPFVDPLLVLEAARQSAILCCLRHLGAAPDACFVVRSAELRIVHPLRHEPGDPPWDVILHCHPDDLRTIDGELAGGTLRMTLHANDVAVASISFAFSALAPELYRSLREPGMQRARDHTPATPPRYLPLEPGHLGRKNADNVVIAAPDAETPRDWPVIVRTDHAGFFDHPLDHVSAAVIVEACRQAAHATCPALAVTGDLVSMHARFSAFAELGPPLYARVADVPLSTHEEASLTVSLIQLGASIATVDVTLRATAEIA